MLSAESVQTMWPSSRSMSWQRVVSLPFCGVAVIFFRTQRGIVSKSSSWAAAISFSRRVSWVSSGSIAVFWVAMMSPVSRPSSMSMRGMPCSPAIFLTALSWSSCFRPLGLSCFVTTPTMLYWAPMRPRSRVAENSGVPMKTTRIFGTTLFWVVFCPVVGVSVARGAVRKRLRQLAIAFFELVIFLLFFEAVADKDAVEVVDFVLDNDGQKSVGPELLREAELVSVLHGNGLGTDDREIFSREGETTFFEDDLFLGIRSDFGIDEIVDRLVDFGDGEPERLPDLGCSQSHPFFAVHRLYHFW